ncbi:MAG: hypothetical protein JOY75_24295 [Hyphomicrobiales bacterium]|nr:hypothetical protein [Hyphomicrobiales bacterium]
MFSLELATRVLGDRLPPGKFGLSLWPDCLQRGRGPPFPRGVLSFDRIQFGLALDDAFARAPVRRFPFIKLAIAEQSIRHAAEQEAAVIEARREHRMRRKSRLPSRPWSAGQTCGGSLGSRPKSE